ncbi:MAG: VIT family protein [Erythrobacter sp.]|nr:VIT family protein [Erythrobacter sp.]
MTDPSAHPDDPHFVNRSGWLRAAVLGGNDGIVSVASLILGVAAASPTRETVLLAGVAGLIAGALSMAAGEYISVSSQADLEKADTERERRALAETPQGEFAELVGIYEARGLSAATARAVASELTAKDPLEAHLRDELGLTEEQAARPLLAAAASGVTFSLAASVPLLTAALVPAERIVPFVVAVSLAALALLGALGARAGGARRGPAVLRVLVWGAFAMGLTALVGWLFGVSV